MILITSAADLEDLVQLGEGYVHQPCWQCLHAVQRDDGDVDMLYSVMMKR